MINYYIIEIKGKDIKRVLTTIFKLKLNIINIKYQKNRVLLKISYEDYKKLKTIKTSYQINIIKICGSKRFKEVLNKYKVSVFTLIISVFFVIFLSNLILFINIETENKGMKSLIKEELNENKITLFSKKKTYDNIEKISTNIKNNNLDKIEWLSLNQRGVTLNIKVIERIANKTTNNKTPKDIVADKNGYIKKIYSKKGEIIKNIDDYVKKGEVIISGNIFKNNKVVAKTHAEGKVYAEVWYIVKSNKSYEYLKDNISDKGYFKITVKVLNKDFCPFKIKKNITSSKSNKIFGNNLFSIFVKHDRIHYQTHSKYTDKKLTNILVLQAKNSISKTLENGEYIIKQKTLKKYKYNGKMYIEIFFKTYEDIGKEKDIQKIIEKENED